MNSNENYNENENSDYFSDFTSSENIFESDLKINDETKILKIMIINEQIMIIDNFVIDQFSAVRTFVNKYNITAKA